MYCSVLPPEIIMHDAYIGGRFWRMKITRKANNVAENLQLYRVVRFFRLRSSCTTHISADVQRITLMRHAWRSPVEEPNNSYSAASLAFTSDFIGFIVVELIRFFHGALQLAITRQQRVDRNTELGMKDVRATADIPHQFQGQRSRSQVALDDRWRHHLRRAGTCGGYTAGRTACFVVVFVFVNNQYNDCTFWRCEFVAQYFCIAQFFFILFALMYASHSHAHIRAVIDGFKSRIFSSPKTFYHSQKGHCVGNLYSLAPFDAFGISFLASLVPDTVIPSKFSAYGTGTLFSNF